MRSQHKQSSAFMKKISIKTKSSERLSDTVTPVGLYLRFRDRYPNTLLLESSDYHSKEESYSFICVEPIVSMKVEDHVFSAEHAGETYLKEVVFPFIILILIEIRSGVSLYHPNPN